MKVVCKLIFLFISDDETSVYLSSYIYAAEVAARAQPSRPRTLKKSEAKVKDRVAEDRLSRGQG